MCFGMDIQKCYCDICVQKMKNKTGPIRICFLPQPLWHCGRKIAVNIHFHVTGLNFNHQQMVRGGIYLCIYFTVVIFQRLVSHTHKENPLKNIFLYSTQPKAPRVQHCCRSIFEMGCWVGESNGFWHMHCLIWFTMAIMRPVIHFRRTLTVKMFIC